jgi:hypothetical protein
MEAQGLGRKWIGQPSHFSDTVAAQNIFGGCAKTYKEVLISDCVRVTVII